MYLLYPEMYIYRVLLYKHDFQNDEDMKCPVEGPDYYAFMCRLGPSDS